VLNSPDTLNLNSYQKPAFKASIANKQQCLNNFNILWSPEFLYDTNSVERLSDSYLENGLDPVLKLPVGTPPFQKTYGYQPDLIYQRKLQDIRTNHHPLFYSDLLLKEFDNGGEDVPLSSICDSDRLSFKIRMGQDEINPIAECPPWILFDSAMIEETEISLPPDYRGVENLRIDTISLRNNFILREVSPTGTATNVFTLFTPDNELPSATFFLPETFPYLYEGSYVDFPGLPLVDTYGAPATVADIKILVNGQPWNAVSVDPMTGEIQIDPYPIESYDSVRVLTASDVSANGVLLPGYPTGPVTVEFNSVVYSEPDFQINGRWLTWNSSVLKTLLSVGSEIRIVGPLNLYVNAQIEFTYHVRSSFLTGVMSEGLSRILDNGDVFPGGCYDQERMYLNWQLHEYYTFLDDFSDGIRIQYFNSMTEQVEEHIFSGPVFEYYDIGEDQIGAPESFPNALIRIQDPIHPGNPLTNKTDYGFINDAVVRYRMKTFKELLPDRTFRTMYLTEMMPV
jgi:hypothetical protein